MAERKMTVNIPRQSIIYLVLCLTGIAIFILGGILPNSWTMSELDHQATDARFRLEETRALGPLQKSLREKITTKESAILPLPQKGKLARTEIDTLPTTFGALAKTSGLSLMSAVPNLSALTGDAAALSVNVALRGEFINFRKFLIRLGGDPSVQQIEEITLQQRPDGKEFRLKIWVAVG
jgi:Tfp pilus assembly protein PilO